jgi:hypothetical protein
VPRDFRSTGRFYPRPSGARKERASSLPRAGLTCRRSAPGSAGIPVGLGRRLEASPPRPEPSNGGPPAALQHDQTSRIHTTTSRCNTRGSNPHSPASLEQPASPTQHKETSFQQVARSMQQAAKRVEHQETSFQHDARALPQLARPVERPERLQVVARTPAGGFGSSRAEAKTPANVASRLREGPESAADGPKEGTGGLAGAGPGATTGRVLPGTRAAGRRPRLRCRSSLGRSIPARTSSGQQDGRDADAPGALAALPSCGFCGPTGCESSAQG